MGFRDPKRLHRIDKRNPKAVMSSQMFGLVDQAPDLQASG
jgi:hypothetical protein